VIVATWEPHQHTVLEAIKRSGIERQVIFNKGAVMILPAGINKAKGLDAVLKELNFCLHNVVAAGDAENDSAMLQAAECAVAVQNALPALKEAADWVTDKDHGDGIIELIDQLLKDDLESLDPKLRRHHLVLGKTFEGQEYSIQPHRGGVLLAGTSGGGKSTLTTFFMESLAEKKYQFCLVDPEGDYDEFKGAITIGDAEHLPVIEEIIELLKNPLQNVVINTLAIPMHDRPQFFNKLMEAMVGLRKTLGHPHWFIFDEAHHLMPAEVENSFFNIPKDLNNFILVTTEPDLINPSVMDQINLVVAIGDDPVSTLRKYAEAKKILFDSTAVRLLEKGEAWIWESDRGKPFPVRCERPQQLLKRHKKKYAAGDMQENSFYFTGPSQKLKLKANNLMMFMQMAEGIDDDTWTYHLGRKDYSNWFRSSLHDDELADFTEKIENGQTDPAASKESVLNLIKERYTAPA